MKYLNSPFLAIACLMGFIWLAHASLERRQIGYSVSVFSVLDKPFKERQADALKDIYGLTDADVSAPVKLWSEK